ncbi:cobalamin-dependent protein [Ferruginibacter paludis]|uniref:cobalamin-dependent protein n=1 Tax=Ferruginibacter paludis TaxID=1310417 RepID=UPI0025B3197C|nr:cobalamin-dependent protein [Ferruginibacter paludis]MDN3659029.1 cobalamin-dependent protein [Ferruginibacter paludis]
MPFTNTKIRIVTAAALFDGHDAAINIMRRILQAKGAEIIHLGHNRSVHEIVECAIEEDANAIAITSYQGGHLEFFKYMKDLLDESGCGHIKIFGGGGGTILPAEIEELQQYGITRIYSPDDGRMMGLEGMIEDVINKAGQASPTLQGGILESAERMPFPLGEVYDIRLIARAITLAEQVENYSHLVDRLKANASKPLKSEIPRSTGGGASDAVAILGITGTGGAGKSSVTDEIVRRFLNSYSDKTIAVISVDPSKKKTGGALLGDRIRMNAISSSRAYMRSLATRQSDFALSKYVQDAIDICKAAGYDFIIVESAGVGQSDASILDYVDVSMYVMTPEYGAPSQLEKINMLDYADVICINKFDKAGALDALHDVRKQYKRNHELWEAKDDELPVVGTIAAQFNDAGINELFERLMETVAKKTGVNFNGEIEHHAHLKDTTDNSTIIPPRRVRYLSEIAETISGYNTWAEEQAAIATKLYQLGGVIKMLDEK